MEIVPKLISEGHTEAGMWLLKNAQVKIKKLIESDQPLDMKKLLSYEEPKIFKQGIGLTVFATPKMSSSSGNSSSLTTS